MKIKSLLFVLLALIVVSCGNKKTEETAKPELNVTDLTNQAKQLFPALPDKMPGSENDTPEMIALGNKLYHEKAMSINKTQSCNSCHDVDTKAGVDNLPTSPGALGKNGARNSPTVLNAGFQFLQMWDGKFKDLVEQAGGPILNPVEMGMKSEKDVEKAINEIPEYKDLFAKAFPKDPKVSFMNIKMAIAAFERTLITKSKYDDFIAGNPTALNKEEQNGLNTFITAGCITCHTGNLFGGSMFQKMGLIKPYTNSTDLGRFAFTNVEADKNIFKVPQLRNIALTAPYFHDGGAKTLEDAVKTMAEINLGKTLTPEELKSIVAFLNTLSKK